MKKLDVQYVSASEAGGEYFQVLFEERRDSLRNYFLIQRNFEFDDDDGDDDDDEPDPPYLESDDMRFSGFLQFDKVELNSNRFYLRLADKDKSELEISFTISDKHYQKVKRVLKVILSGFDFKRIE